MKERNHNGGNLVIGQAEPHATLQLLGTLSFCHLEMGGLKKKNF